MVVGWYHSHPGFGCWLSGVDINTQQSFEALSERAVAVVVDPIQSVKGKVSMPTLDSFFARVPVDSKSPRIEEKVKTQILSHYDLCLIMGRFHKANSDFNQNLK